MPLLAKGLIDSPFVYALFLTPNWQNSELLSPGHTPMLRHRERADYQIHHQD